MNLGILMVLWAYLIFLLAGSIALSIFYSTI